MSEIRACAAALLLGLFTLLASAAAEPVPAAAPAPAAAAAAPAAPASPELSSYEVGLVLGAQLEHAGAASQINVEALVKGLREALNGRAVSTQERDAAGAFLRGARDALADKNRAAAREFLEKNGKVSDVVTMPSGLQYRVLLAGDAKAKAPGPMDTVTVRYRAMLADGTEFDRSDAHDRAASFRVNSVLKAWQEAFQNMKPGARWQLFVPPELGYGANTPPPVPPGSLIVYDLELLKVERAPPMPARAPGEGFGSAPQHRHMGPQ